MSREVVYAEFVARLDRTPAPNVRLQKTCKRQRRGISNHHCAGPLCDITMWLLILA
ncbi:MAG: hypothetical protein JXR24_01090 [Acidithiobacillaceae bacterium]|nr:hypothetical protein [Acidithiobacillaceae bacterium]